MRDKTLYELSGLKRDKSILKSVTITKQRSYEGFPIIEIEAFDDTFINASNSPSKRDEVHEKLVKSIKKYSQEIQDYLDVNDKQFWLIDYSTFDNRMEKIINVNRRKRDIKC